jgi:hypothetical protein
MEWLNNNWIWAVIALGTLVFMFSGRGGCGMGHSHHSYDRKENDRSERTGVSAVPERGVQANDDKGPRAAERDRHHHACC